VKIIRYLDPVGRVRHAAEQPGGGALAIAGDIFGDWRVTGEVAQIARLLAPVAPVQIVCIGLNYRRHAEETKAKIPAHPVVFFKNLGAVHPSRQP
jgi:2-keto-4-pentenoate hydratase/2-oxohepta-3-ene-1,7-dioic acid hydratase in catechol pathway